MALNSMIEYNYRYDSLSLVTHARTQCIYTGHRPIWLFGYTRSLGPSAGSRSSSSSASGADKQGSGNFVGQRRARQARLSLPSRWCRRKVKVKNGSGSRSRTTGPIELYFRPARRCHWAKSTPTCPFPRTSSNWILARGQTRTGRIDNNATLPCTNNNDNNNKSRENIHTMQN